MNLDEHLKANGISVADVSERTGLPYSTIGDVVKGRTSIENASVRVLARLSDALGMSMEEAYGLAKESAPLPGLEGGYSLSLKNGRYYISYQGKASYLCRRTNETAFYIKEIAETFVKNRQIKERMGSWMEML